LSPATQHPSSKRQAMQSTMLTLLGTPTSKLSTPTLTAASESGQKNSSTGTPSGLMTQISCKQLLLFPASPVPIARLSTDAASSPASSISRKSRQQMVSASTEPPGKATDHASRRCYKAKQSYFFYTRCDLRPDFLVLLPLR
jgi:hypothetical protein